MPDTKLLPCPFCGGPADVLARPLGVAVECRWCDSSIGEVIHDAAAIEKWNTRAALQASGKGEPLSEDKRDAERYRKWRDAYCAAVDPSVMELDDMLLELADTWEPAQVDAAIDRAMSEKP